MLEPFFTTLMVLIVVGVLGFAWLTYTKLFQGQR